jgi:hypothetical protein
MSKLQNCVQYFGQQHNLMDITAHVLGTTRSVAFQHLFSCAFRCKMVTKTHTRVITIINFAEGTIWSRMIKT